MSNKHSITETLPEIDCYWQISTNQDEQQTSYPKHKEVTQIMQVADDKGKFFTFFVDGKEYHTTEPQITGGQIMDIAGIPRSTGLIEIMEDGLQVQINENEVIEFKGPGRRFKKAPRFKRG